MLKRESESAMVFCVPGMWHAETTKKWIAQIKTNYVINGSVGSVKRNTTAQLSQ